MFAIKIFNLGGCLMMGFDEDKVWAVLFGFLSLVLGGFAFLGFKFHGDQFILGFFGLGAIMSFQATGFALSSLLEKKDI